jgi:hypothetical protein
MNNSSFSRKLRLNPVRVIAQLAPEAIVAVEKLEQSFTRLRLPLRGGRAVRGVEGLVGHRRPLRPRRPCRLRFWRRSTLPGAHPGYFADAQHGGIFLLDKHVRLASDGVFVADQKVADFGQIVENITRTDLETGGSTIVAEQSAPTTAGAATSQTASRVIAWRIGPAVVPMLSCAVTGSDAVINARTNVSDSAVFILPFRT